MVVKLNEKLKNDGTSQLQLVWSANGKRKQETLKDLFLLQVPKEKALAKLVKAQNKLVLQQAERLRIEKELSIQTGSFVKKVPTLMEFYVQTKHERSKAMEMSLQTLSSWRTSELYLIDFLKAQGKENMLISEFTAQDLSAYQQYLLSVDSIKAKVVKRKLSNATINLTISKLTCVLNEAVRQDFVRPSVLNTKKALRVEKKELEYLNKKEIGMLEKTPYRIPCIRLAFLIGVYSGLRISDLTNLKWSHITDNVIVTTMQKTKHKVMIPISKALECFLKECRELYPNSEYVLGNLRQYTNERNHLLKEWFAIAGVEKRAFFHLSRHTFATQLVSNGVDIYVISKLCGHSSVRVTEQHYSTAPLENLVNAVKTFDK